MMDDQDSPESSTSSLVDDVGVETRTARSVWDGHDDETYRRDQSHWRGVGRWKDDQLWRSWGAKSVARFNLIGDHVGLGARMWARRWRILEWGPGGGAHLHALHGHASDYFGVDISPKNLAESERMISEEGFRGFRPILLDGDLSVVEESIGKPVDLFLSSAVFQHFPSKEYGESVLKTIARVCRPGALGYIQIRFDNGNPKYAPVSSLGEYEKKHITANSYSLDEFWSLCTRSGFEVLFISHLVLANNYATFNLRRRG